MEQSITKLLLQKNTIYKSMWIWWSAGLASIILEIWIMYLAIRMWGKGIISLIIVVLLQALYLELLIL